MKRPFCFTRSVRLREVLEVRMFVHLVRNSSHFWSFANSNLLQLSLVRMYGTFRTCSAIKNGCTSGISLRKQFPHLWNILWHCYLFMLTHNMYVNCMMKGCVQAEDRRSMWWRLLSEITEETLIFFSNVKPGSGSTYLDSYPLHGLKARVRGSRYKAIHSAWCLRGSVFC